MDKAPSSSQTIRFGDFELDVHEKELRKQGIRIKLQDQPLQILRILLESPGTVVTREELQRQLWPSDTFVDFEHGLYNAVKRLREALLDVAEKPRFIETVPRRGYRFVGCLESAQSSGRCGPIWKADDGLSFVPDTAAFQLPAIGNAPDHPLRDKPLDRPLDTVSFQLPAIAGFPSQSFLEVPQGRAPASFLARTRAPAFLAFGVLLTSVSLFGFDVGGLRTQVLLRLFPPSIHSLAVLPLQNLSGDPAQEYFADGVTDALITDLAKVDTLKVISRTSSMYYKQPKKSLPEIARELNVDYIVEGTIQRYNDRVRVTVQLIYAPRDRHLWARSYDREGEDVLLLQNTLADAIAEEIRVQLVPKNAPDREPRDP
jgi:TolB-like protein/DNA-binding winged helix-turn-helix (wHTH) protein